MRVEESIEIRRPLNEVFDYVANPENLPEWSSLAIEVKDAPEPLIERALKRQVRADLETLKDLLEAR